MCSNNLNYICLSFLVICLHDVVLIFLFKTAMSPFNCLFLPLQYTKGKIWHLPESDIFSYIKNPNILAHVLAIAFTYKNLKHLLEILTVASNTVQWQLSICLFCVSLLSNIIIQNMHLTSLELFLLNLSWYFTFPATPSSSIVAKGAAINADEVDFICSSAFSICFW